MLSSVSLVHHPARQAGRQAAREGAVREPGRQRRWKQIENPNSKTDTTNARGLREKLTWFMTVLCKWGIDCRAAYDASQFAIESNILNA